MPRAASEPVDAHVSEDRRHCFSVADFERIDRAGIFPEDVHVELLEGVFWRLPQGSPATTRPSFG